MKIPIQFDYEYFKKNPKTELQYRNGERAYFIGANPKANGGCNELVVCCDDSSMVVYPLSGIYNGVKNHYYDLFMLVDVPEPKVVIEHHNVYKSGINSVCHTSLEQAIVHSCTGAISVVKLTITDGIVTDFETVHKY